MRSRSERGGPAVPRKLVYVVTRMIVGGAQESAKLTAEHFHQKGERVLLVIGTDRGREGHLVADVPTLVLPHLVRPLSALNDLRAAWSIYRILRGERPDIVHSRTAKARFLTAFAASLARVPVAVQTIHGYSFNNEVEGRRRLYALLERVAARLYDCSVVVSEADRDEGLALSILKPETTELIRSAVDLDRIRSVDATAVEELRRRHAPEGQKIVTLVGRLSTPKTPDVFVRAASMVAKGRPGVVFLIAGDGERRERVAALVADLRLDGTVVMLGLRPDVPEVLAASDIVVHSSTHDGLPKVVLEGMAAGRPVVATRVGAVPHVVEDGVTGLLAEPLDPEGMAASIERLLGDDVLARRLAANASRRLHEFSVPRMLEDTERLYDRLTASAGQRERRRPELQSERDAAR